MPNAIARIASSLCMAALCVASATRAAPFEVVIETPSLAGTSADLAFDLIDGGPPSNSLTIQAFSTDAALGASVPTGGVSGALPADVTLDDSEFFNEYLQHLVLGNFIRFVVDTTGNPPDPSAFPDALSVFLLDPSSGLPLFATSDPTGADALITQAIGVDALATAYASTSARVVVRPVTTAVPEPTTSLLVLTALGVLAMLEALQRASRQPG